MRAWTITIAGFASFLLGAARSPEPIVYTLSAAPGRTLQVEIRLRGDADGETEIDLPDHWAGTTELWRGVSGFQVEGGTFSGTGGTRIVRHLPNAPLVIRYRVSSGGAEADNAGEKARPIVEANWFFFHGEGVFAVPAGREKAPVRFRWDSIPAGWKVASDLDHIAARDGTLDELVESTGIGGPDVTIVTRAVAGVPLRVAIRGAWDFAPADLADRVARIMAAEHRFWRDPPHPFIVVMAPFPPLAGGGISYTGTGRGDGFSILSTPGFELKQATRTLAHEYMHHWDPVLLGNLPAEKEGREYWFSEGFDDYLTTRVLLGSGLWSLSDWLADKNEVLLRYDTSPARSATGSEIAEKFWKEEPFERISYDRGHLLALLLDARVRAATSGRRNLDDVVRVQRRLVRPGGPTAGALLAVAVREVAGIDVRPELRRHAVDGEPFLLSQSDLPLCLRVKTETRHGFTRGFDAEATAAAGMSIRGTDPSGPAYAAGIRDGMKLIKRETGTIGDSSREIAYRVADAQGEHVIRYLPAARETFEVQQLESDVGLSHEAELCHLLLGGTFE